MHGTKKIDQKIFKEERENRRKKIYSELLARPVRKKDRYIFGEDLDYISNLQPLSEILYKRIVIKSFESGVNISDSALSLVFITKLNSDEVFRSIVEYLYKSFYNEFKPNDSYNLAVSLKNIELSTDNLKDYIVSAAKYLGTIYDCRKEFEKTRLKRKKQADKIKEKNINNNFPIGTIELEPLSYLDFYTIKVENLAWAAEILYEDFQLDIKCLFDY